ncbi:phage tail terminator-like protein [Caulobacter segnis]|uniref:DUF3168 domain-containing protein n=1 Tax=Caulobacter segnis TaxID=88688 RepID=A0A2W5V8Z9_9CAUL|nr:phage tail terminator-like protein [Caulobacter segnis]PZR36489.1 MAG: hypothetical protein DI526_03370 [Caulobacter segnis]
MSFASVRAALETALNGIAPPLSTAWENTAFTPVVGTPYQRAVIIPAAPANDEIGRAYNERGIFQVSLHFPPNTGPAAAYVRADLIRATFYRGATFPKDGITVQVVGTPTILPPQDDDQGRYVLPVSINFRASAQT